MAQTCFPDNGRSLPNIHLHPRHEGFFVQSCPNLLGRCGLEKELQCFTEIREGMFDTVSLSVITRFDVPLITIVEGPDQQYAAAPPEGVRRRLERRAWENVRTEG